MTLHLQIENESCSQIEDETVELDNDLVASPQANRQPHSETPAEPILCPHCLRTASNGNKCKGLCVADSDY